jgi:exosortase/archaeosortase family protein
VNRMMAGFALRFGLSAALLFWLSHWEPFVTWVREPYCKLLAASCWVVLQAVGIDATLAGATLSHGGTVFELVIDCDGIPLICLFLAAVYALPDARIGWELAVGVAVLVFMNWIRVFVLVLAAFFFFSAFDVLHYYVFQGLLILGTLGVYIVWANRVQEIGLPEAGDAEAATS